MKKPSASTNRNRTGQVKSDSEKEPELINTISPRRAVIESGIASSHSSIEQQSSHQQANNGGASSGPKIQGKNSGNANGKQAVQPQRVNLQEILSLIQNPLNFRITAGKQSADHSMTDDANNMITIHEEDIPNYIENCIDQGLSAIDKNQLKEAVQHFRNAEVLIDTFMQQDGSVDTDLMLAVVINLGICFYRAGLFDEAYSCFENSDMRLKKKIAQKQKDLSDNNGNDGMNDDHHFEHSATTFTEKLARRIKRKKLRLSLNLQMCILFSEIGKHEDAIEYAKNAAKIAIQTILDQMMVCYVILIQTNLPKGDLACLQDQVDQKILIASKKDSDTNNLLNKSTNQSTILIFQDLLRELAANQPSSINKGNASPTAELAMKCLPVLHYISANFSPLREGLSDQLSPKNISIEQLRYLYDVVIESTSTTFTNEGSKQPTANALSSPNQIDMYFLSSAVKDDHWLLSSNILNLLQMKPIQLATIQAKPHIMNEVTSEVMVKSIVHAAITFYCISTEARFMEEQKYINGKIKFSNKVSDSEYWLGKSLEIAYTFIPQDALMISQIINVFTRFHGIEKQTIPEDEDFPDSIKYLKPQKGVNITGSSVMALRNNFFIPVIRTMLPPIAKKISKREDISAEKTNSRKNNINSESLQIEEDSELEEECTDFNPTNKLSNGDDGNNDDNNSINFTTIINNPSDTISSQPSSQIKQKTTNFSPLPFESTPVVKQQQHQQSEQMPLNNPKQDNTLPSNTTDVQQQITFLPTSKQPSSKPPAPSQPQKIAGLKVEEQNLHQQKQIGALDSRIRSVSRENRTTNTGASTFVSKDAQKEVLDKIELLVKKQRPHSSQSSASQSTNNSSTNKQQFLTAQQQSRAGVCLTEPSEPNRNSELTIKASSSASNNNQPILVARNHARTLYLSPPSRTISQQPTTKPSRRTSMNSSSITQQPSSTKSETNQPATLTAAIQQSFLKSFNQFVKQQQQQQQIQTRQPQVPSPLLQRPQLDVRVQHSTTATGTSAFSHASVIEGNTIGNSSSQNNNSSSNASTNQRKALNQNFFESQRVSIADTNQGHPRVRPMSSTASVSEQKQFTFDLINISTTPSGVPPPPPPPPHISDNTVPIRKVSETNGQQFLLYHSFTQAIDPQQQLHQQQQQSHQHPQQFATSSSSNAATNIRMSSADKRIRSKNSRNLSLSNNPFGGVFINPQKSFDSQTTPLNETEGSAALLRSIEFTADSNKPTKYPLSSSSCKASSSLSNTTSSSTRASIHHTPSTYISYLQNAQGKLQQQLLTIPVDENRAKPPSRQLVKRKSTTPHTNQPLNFDKLNLTMNNPRQNGITVTAVQTPSNQSSAQTQQLNATRQPFARLSVTGGGLSVVRTESSPTGHSLQQGQQHVFSSLEGGAQSQQSMRLESAQRKRRIKTEHFDFIDDARLRSSLDRPSANQMRVNTLF